MLRATLTAASRRSGETLAAACRGTLGPAACAWALTGGTAAAAAADTDSRGSRSYAHSSRRSLSGSQWEVLRNQGFAVNPCNSKLHPSVTEAGIEPESEEELSVQEAYTPESTCWGCGPVAKDGLFLRSYRIPGGLEATAQLDPKYCAFPGIINGGVVSALFDCHGNWTAAIALMDKAALPKPPLTLTYEMLATFKEATPPDEPLILRSQIVRIKESESPGSKATVQVDMNLYHSLGGHEKLLASATGIFKKLGALRAL
ncbi:hypothetical protein CHLNCDRAFT_59311 [Chlorella variabilis]|uniref:Thioesterase domain-containing protein n=1 Tax=Chlorella variabilis TaxID=554065 RepID=E1ZSN0_CHLVA|nr:hypothetical protein CHLNCDRAFT_59311 [Chlorella variabilis]EFN51182.1 hypothetical protein CHLNCDRAFT_59311 [Chlorella variabilis]|eukprot:XP_005843284.1 hypothetical protein CHLNCDRAFT_59311 [Chlorella variabilis]